MKVFGWLKKIALLILILFLFYVIAVIAYGTITDYQPAAIIDIQPDQPAMQITGPDSIISLMTWNIGYGGLGAESDFFFADGRFFLSGGMMVRPPQTIVQKNVNGVLQTIAKNPTDIILLQEVDTDAKRSYGINQYESIGGLLEKHESQFALNFKTAYSPIPILEPWNVYGYSNSGLATYSKYPAIKSTRYQLPGIFRWPNRLFMLDRCAMEHRYPAPNGKTLVVYNIHNSAYDKDGSVKQLQLSFLKEKWLAEYQAGNYVIVGGDWNQVPPFFQANYFRPNHQEQPNPNIPIELMPADWLWLYDPGIPTVRDSREIYTTNKTYVTLIDYFLLSPNVRAIKAEGIDVDFQFSDHQPVRITVALL